MALQAGKLRHRLSLQSFTETFGSSGQQKRSYATLDTVWGQVQPLTGAEPFYAEAVKAQITHAITIRYRTDLQTSPDFRLLHRTRVFEIKSIIQVDEKLAEFRLMCTEVVK